MQDSSTDLDKVPLNEAQKRQLIEMLIQIFNHGFGKVEIRIEKGEIHWFRPRRTTYNPKFVPIRRYLEATLESLMGAWQESLYTNLDDIIQQRYGSVFIGIEHGRVRYLEAVPDVRAHTGKTDELHLAARM